MVPQKHSSGFVVLAKITAPAASSRATAAEERSGTKPRSASEPFAGLHALQPGHVLDGHRHAQQGPALAAGQRRVGRVGRRAGALVEAVGEGVERLRDAVGPLQDGVERLAGREVAAGQRRDQVGRIELRGLHRGVRPPAP